MKFETTKGIENLFKEINFTDVPDKSVVIYNLQALQGLFLARGMRKALQTTYWAEQILKNEELMILEPPIYLQDGETFTWGKHENKTD